MPRRANRSGFGIHGVRQVTRNVELALGKKTVAAGVETRNRAYAVLARSQQLVPVDTGQLLGSGRVDEVRKGPGGHARSVGRPGASGRFESGALGFRVSYGNDQKVNYAVPVHERLDVHHPHGEAKYLEKAVKQVEAGYASDVASAMRAAE